MRERRYDLDWLRVLGTLAVFVYHLSMFFNDWGWHVKNVPPSFGFSMFSLTMGQWIMPLFFTISGVSAYLAFGHRPAGVFVRERLLRLGVPLVTGMLLLAPPQVYIERLTRGGFQGSFWQFLPRYFDGLYGMGGNFAWHGLHLWYVMFLLVFSVVTLPLFRWLRSRMFDRPGLMAGGSPEAGSGAMAPWLILLFPLVMAASELVLDLATAGAAGWNVLTYLLLYVCGFAFFSQPACRAAVVRTGFPALTVGVAATVGLQYWMAAGGWPHYGEAAYPLLALLKSVHAWYWVVGLFALAERYLNRPGDRLAYWGPVAMPFYVLHQPVIVVLGYLVREMALAPVLKFPLLALAAFGVIMALYEFGVRRVGVLRFLAGVK